MGRTILNLYLKYDETHTVCFSEDRIDVRREERSYLDLSPKQGEQIKRLLFLTDRALTQELSHTYIMRLIVGIQEARTERNESSLMIQKHVWARRRFGCGLGV